MNRYTQLSVECGSGLDWASDTIKVAAVSSAYTFSASHRFLNEVTGVLGSTTLAGKTVKTDGFWDADDVADLATPGSTFVDSLIIYKDTGNPETSGLLFQLDSSDDADLPYDPVIMNPERVVWGGSGVIRIV